MKSLIIGISLFAITICQGNLVTTIHPDSIFVGMPCYLKITAELGSTQYPRFPEITSQQDKMKVENIEYFNNTVTYTFTFWEVGEAIIPSIPVQIMENNNEFEIIDTDEIKISIYSGLNSTSNDIRDIKQMRNINFIKENNLIIFSTLILLSVIVLVYFWKKRRIQINKADKWIPPPEKPYTAAINSIKSLDYPHPVNSENVERFYLELSSLIRKYIGAEFYFKATEMTTNEVCNYINSRQLFNLDILQNFQSILVKSDLFKYAGFIPENGAFSEDSQICINLIKEIHSSKISTTNNNP